MSQISTRQSAQPVWVWAAIILQFLVLYSLAPALAVFIRANPLAMALRMLMPAGVVVASLFGLWHGRKWGWVLATLVDGLMCLQALLALPEFGVTVIWKFAAVVVLLQRPVRTHFFDPEGYLGRAMPSPRVPAGVSHFAQLTWSRASHSSFRMSPRVRRVTVVAIFCLAGLISAWTYCSYSAWVGSLYRANNRGAGGDIYARGPDGKSWYDENLRLTKYADRQWPILLLGFPSAITVALLIGIGAGLLPNTLVPRMPLAVIRVYAGSALTWVSFFLFFFLWYLSIIPALIVYAYFLGLSAKALTSRWPWKLFHAIWISSIICPVLLLIVAAKLSPRLTWLQGYFLIPMEVTWAGMYGKVLTDSALFSATNAPSIVGTQNKLS